MRGTIIGPVLVEDLFSKILTRKFWTCLKGGRPSFSKPCNCSTNFHVSLYCTGMFLKGIIIENFS